MNAHRLLLVAKALRESRRPQAYTSTRIHTCGTAHCAFGHYVGRRDLQQVFQFPLDELAEQLYQETHGNLFNLVLSGVWGATRPVFHWRRALEGHFDLSASQVELIFGPFGCNEAETAADAAQYIENYVATWSRVDEVFPRIIG